MQGDGNATLLPLSDNSPCAGPIWVHLNYTNPDAREWIMNQADLDPTVQDTLLAEATRPRALILDQGLLLTLRGINHNPGQEPDDMIGIRLWVTPRLIITTQLRSLRAVKVLQRDMEINNAPKDSGQFVARLIELLNDHMLDTIDEVDELTDNFEKTMLQSRTVEPIPDRELADLRSTILTLRRYLGPQRDALLSVISSRLVWIKKPALQRIREAENRLTRYLEVLDASRDQLRIIQEQLNTRSSNELNKQLTFLTALSAIFLPLTFVTGLFGVNLDGIPGNQNHPYAFELFTGVLFLLGILLIYLFRRARLF
ncbi:zinc transporter ZntB [Halothiobacillus sp. DCM-1]|uniref:zinc transporter ZntB n=1 Tax=Halothiobacillus sp. DCM-1 TaxID=3112558 RepID=UPI00325092FD